MSSDQTHDKTDPFVEHLLDLARRRERDGSARAALAHLKRAAGKAPDYPPSALRHVVPWLGDKERPEAKLLVATLFAQAPSEFDGGLNLGAAMQVVYRGRAEGSSIERRFMALLDAAPEEMPAHLRHAVGLIDAAGATLSWSQLLRDLRGLLSGDHDWREDVVRRWATGFWRGRPEDDAEPAKSASASTTQTS